MTRIRINGDWRFGGAIPLPGPVDRLDPAVVHEYSRADLDDSEWQVVTLPHTVVPLSWQHWQSAEWEKVWAYRRELRIPADFAGARLFLDFDGAMTSATVTVNDVVVGEHRGGYLPFGFEVTDLVDAGRANTIGVVLDSRFTINVPPNLPDPALSSSIDYAQPGGIHRDVWLRAEPPTYIASIGVTHADVLDEDARRTTVALEIDSRVERTGGEVFVELQDGDGRTVASSQSSVDRLAAGMTELSVELNGLADVQLWGLERPVLYQVVASLRNDGEVLHTSSIRTGYREARFAEDGFYLNGVRTYLLGVNRHGYFPFAGFAMPDRVHRRDAEIIKRELNCAMVRCSHYPQTASFLDACDELGLLVWEESTGWQYVGDSSWQDRAADDIAQMIRRDRHRPSVVIWGARLNETPDRPDFYARTEALVKKLDPSRQTSGTMHGDYSRTATFQHDVFSYDDYTTQLGDDGERHPVLLAPVEDRPYLISEAVSTRSSPTTFYRRAEHPTVQQHQALDYAHAHEAAMSDARYTGLLAWVGFDYQATMGNHYHGVKVSGLGDVFRILKPGAAWYRAQIDPQTRIVIEPAFTWDPPEFAQADAYGGRPEGRLWGPGEHAIICSNCDRLEVYLGSERLAVAHPDRDRFPNLPYPPTVVDLRLSEHRSADLRIDGYLGNRLVGTREYAGSRMGDSLRLAADAAELVADGVDATRVTLAVVDRFGQARGSSRSRITFEVTGPGTLLGDNPFDLEQTGGVAAVWVRTTREAGTIILRASAPGLGSGTATILSLLPGPAAD